VKGKIALLIFLVHQKLFFCV